MNYVRQAVGSNVLFYSLSFKTSPHLLQYVSAMLFFCEALEMFLGLQNLSKLSIDFSMNLCFKVKAHCFTCNKVKSLKAELAACEAVMSRSIHKYQCLNFFILNT